MHFGVSKIQCEDTTARPCVDKSVPAILATSNSQWQVADAR